MNDQSTIANFDIVVLTMIGCIDIIGELQSAGPPKDTDYIIRVKHPATIQLQPPNNLIIKMILRGSPLFIGEHIWVNAQNVMWITKPSQILLNAYRSARSGLVTTTNLQ